MASKDSLHVLWQAPDDGTRFVIGSLSREPHGYAFAYDLRRGDLDLAAQRGFRLLTEFPARRAAAIHARIDASSVKIRGLTTALKQVPFSCVRGAASLRRRIATVAP